MTRQDRHRRDDSPKTSTRNQLVELALSDPDIRARATNAPLVAQRRQLYSANAQGIKADLASAGFPVVNEVGELRQRGSYHAAVPILIDWLPRVSYLLLAEDIVRTLSVPFAKRQAFPIFYALFKQPPKLEDPMRPPISEPPTEHLRWVLGNGLGIFADPSVADDLIRLAIDRSYRHARTQIVLALPKTKDARVPEILLGLLDDPTVVAFAVEALGKMKLAGARDSIKEQLVNPDKNVRDQAKKALKRIDSAGR